MLAFAAITALIAAGIVGLASVQKTQQAEQALQIAAGRVMAATTSSFNAELLRLESLGRSLAADPRLIQAVRDVNRAAMGEVIDPIYQALRAERQISTFVVVTPPGLLQFRAHEAVAAPEDVSHRRGDAMASLAGQAARGTMMAASGLSLASTVPVRGEGRILGALLVQSLANEELLQRIKDSVNAELV
eukprot:gene51587-63077_t